MEIFSDDPPTRLKFFGDDLPNGLKFSVATTHLIEIFGDDRPIDENFQ